MLHEKSTNVIPLAKKKSPDPIDIYVGERVRDRRKSLDFTQSDLARKLGISSQQVQKYERGENRIGASRLLHTARALEVPIAYLFSGAEEQLLNTQKPMTAADYANHEETQELLDVYYAISNSVVRKKIVDLARMLITDASAYNGAR